MGEIDWPEPTPFDPHPKGAYIDGEKLAILGCPCRFCFEAEIYRGIRRNRV